MNKAITILAIFFLTSCGNEIKEQKTSTSSDLIEQKALEKKSVTDSIKQQQQSSENSYHTILLYGDKLQLSIPYYFTEMSSVMKQGKYSNENCPDVVYTNDEATVNIVFNHTSKVVTSSGLSQLKDEYSRQMQGRVEQLATRIERINGSDFAVFEFTSQAIDTKVYNLMFLTELDGTLLLGTFNCTEALKKQWQSKAKEILSSVRKG